MNIKSIFKLIIPFNYCDKCDLSSNFQKVNLAQTPQLEGKPILDKKMSPLDGVYELSQVARRMIGLHGNEGHTYTLFKGNTEFKIGKLKVWLFKSGIGFMTVHISTSEMSENKVLDLVSELCNIQQKTKISFEQAMSKDSFETRVFTIKDVVAKLFDLIGDEHCSQIDGITYKKACCLFYGMGVASTDDEVYNFLEMLRNQNKSNRTIAGYNSEVIFRHFKYITWVASERVLSAFCDLRVAGKENEKFLTAPGGLIHSVFTNYLLLYLNVLSSKFSLEALEKKYILFEPTANNQWSDEAREEIALYLNSPIVELSNEPHINRLFDDYLYDRALRLKDKHTSLCDGRITVDLDDIKKDVKITRDAVERIEQQLTEWMNSVSNLVSQRKAEFGTQWDCSPEILEQQRSMFVNSVAEEIAKIACNSTSTVNAEENRLKNIFGEYWNRLDVFTKKALVSARVFLANSDSIALGGLDYSGVCISACSALEQELKLRFFIGYKEYLRGKFRNDYSKWPSSMRYTRKNGSLTENTTFTIGNMPAIFGSKQRNEETGKRFDNKNMSVTPEEKALLNEYLKTIMNDKGTDIQAFFKTDSTGLSFLDCCEDVRCVYRNTAAHTESLSIETATECCRDVIGVSGSTASKTVGQVQGLIYDLVRLTNYYNPGRNTK